MWQEGLTRVMVQTVPYSEFKQLVRGGRVKECLIGDTEISGRVEAAKPAPASSPESAAPKESPSPATASPAKTATAVNSPPDKAFMFRTIRVEDPSLTADLQAAHTTFGGVRPSFLSSLLGAWGIPLAIMLIFWLGFSRLAGAAGQSVLGVGRSRAKLLVDKDTGVGFADVAGADEAKLELTEVVDFLKNPERYQSLGAKIPKGVLLVGPPGTGKTLLARAVAGEAKVPFFLLSGSDFVEMFVGVGAARVRDLFRQAKEQAPCIVFIDELDAIGRQRGVHVAGGNDEREQTLNQLLVEMDGFDPNQGVILLGATNRPEVLDRALLRPGRFDRLVLVDAPDLEGREAVLRVHARNKPLNPGVNLHQIAEVTAGFSGADLANLINEAALLAARTGATNIQQSHLEEAFEKVVAGPERKSRRLGETEKRRVAYHEVGHALVAAFTGGTDRVGKISIVPRGKAALGFTMQLPTEQQYLMTRDEILDRVTGLLGGRAAEELVFGEGTTGAESDLERATAMVRQMICVYGMSKNMGLAHLAQRQGPMHLAGPDGSFNYDCSDETAYLIDQEVKELLEACHSRARDLLSERRDLLERVAQELLKKESLHGETFYKLIGVKEPGGSHAEITTPDPLATPG
jgi:cell division protease FtsH